MSLLKIAVARDIRENELVPAFQAVIDGGFDHLEITMNTADAERLISTAAREFGGTVSIGAGTVTSMPMLKVALKAGARFIVSPITDVQMIRYCRKKNIPVYPGALTPTEIYRAFDAGAAMVKVFPIGSMGGASYVRELKGPFRDIPLLASGGVSPENIDDFIRSGVSGIAIGGQLFRREWLESRSFGCLTEMARKFHRE